MPQPKAFMTRPVARPGIDRVREHFELQIWDGREPPSRETLLDRAKEIEGLYCLLTERVDEELLQAAPRLRVISVMAAGYDNVDVKACTRRGIPVGHTPGVLTETTADFTWALILAGARRLTEAERAPRTGEWLTWEPLGFLGQDVHGATLGILGMGRIGAAVARRACGFRMTVLYHNRRRVPDVETEANASYVGLDVLLERSDFVTVHTPLTKETHHLIGEAELARMKPTAVLVNAARGGIVDQGALYRALADRQIGYAALDVTEPEPIPSDDPLLSLDNCLILPHMGSASRATREKMALMAADNLIAGLHGQRLPHCANPEVYERS